MPFSGSEKTGEFNLRQPLFYLVHSSKISFLNLYYHKTTIRNPYSSPLNIDSFYNLFYYIMMKCI
jgi:hypothetical protein